MISCVGIEIVLMLPFRFEPMRSQHYRGILPNLGFDWWLGITSVLGFYGLIKRTINRLSFGSIKTYSIRSMVLGRPWMLQFWTRVEHIWFRSYLVVGPRRYGRTDCWTSCWIGSANQFGSGDQFWIGPPGRLLLLSFVSIENKTASILFDPIN